MTGKAGQPGAPGRNASPAGQAPSAGTSGDVGGKPEPQGYYAYLKVADGEIRLSGGYVSDKIIELKGKGVLAYVSQSEKGWAASIAISNHTYDLIVGHSRRLYQTADLQIFVLHHSPDLR